MGNGIVTFEINGTEYTLRFGMIATEIFSKKAIQETLLMEERGEIDSAASNFKSFAICVYAGFCNQCDVKEKQYPTWEEVYNLTEEICYDIKLQELIWETFKNSRPAKELFDKLNPFSEDKKKVKSTGKK